MKILHIFYFTLVLILLSSCSKEQAPNDLDNSTPLTEESELSTIALMLTDIGIDLTMSNEVHEAALKSLGYGQDENWRFIEIMDPKNSILTKSAPESKLKSAIEEYYFQNNLTKSGAEAEAIDLLNSNVHIYWPYSEDWDGEETPAITFAPSDDSQLWNYGYKRRITADGEVIIDKIIVDEEYAMENPVWIINYSERLYEDLPNFSKGEITKNGITFFPRNEKLNNSLTPTNTEMSRTNSTGINVMLDYFRATYNWDSFWQGGSEFNFRMSFHPIIGWETFRSRAQCHAGTPWRFDTAMIVDWQNYITSHVVCFYEWDGRENDKEVRGYWRGSIGVNATVYLTEVRFPRWKADSFIFMQNFPRDVRTSVEFYNKSTYKSSNVFWKFHRY